MIDRNIPIYDNSIASFYMFRHPQPKRGQSPTVNLAPLLAFLNFLKIEYSRVLNAGLLTRSITAFRAKFKTTVFTDTKIIDSLIFAFVRLARKQQIQYK